MSSSPLDNPAWTALTGPHAHFAEQKGQVLRYPVDVSPFLGVPDAPDEHLWRDIADLAGPGATAVIVGGAGALPEGWTRLNDIPGVQLDGSGLATQALEVEGSNAGGASAGGLGAGGLRAREFSVGELSAGEPGPEEFRAGEPSAGQPSAGGLRAGGLTAGELRAGELRAGEPGTGEPGAEEFRAGGLIPVRLGEADAPEMLDLVAWTQPGPFLARTVSLGTYLGFRSEGALVAMAGERMHLPGWTEISAVCTDPAFRGRGLAARLVRAVGAGIRARGEVPFLHTAASNVNAIRLYESLGFRLRREVVFSAVRVPGPAES